MVLHRDSIIVSYNSFIVDRNFILVDSNYIVVDRRPLSSYGGGGGFLQDQPWICLLELIHYMFKNKKKKIEKGYFQNGEKKPNMCAIEIFTHICNLTSNMMWDLKLDITIPQVYF